MLWAQWFAAVTVTSKILPIHMHILYILNASRFCENVQSEWGTSFLETQEKLNYSYWKINLIVSHIEFKLS